MYLSDPIRLVVTAFALGAIAGCSAGASSSSPALIAASQPQSASRSAMLLGTDQSAPDLSPGFANADAATTGAFIITTQKSNDVFVYSNARKLVAKITGLNTPERVAVGPTGELYIANTYGADFRVYKNDYKTLVARLVGDGAQYSGGVDVDRTTGVVGVTWLQATSGGPGGVAFFAKGAQGTKTPCASVPGNNNFFTFAGGAFDANGNFYIVGLDVNSIPVVGVAAGGCSAKTISVLTTGNSLAEPLGIKVSPAGKILISDAQSGSIYSYNPPVNGALGMPVITKLQGDSAPGEFALTKDGSHVWVGNFTQSAPSIREFTYPAGGAPISKFPFDFPPFGQPFGLALTAAAHP